MNNPEEISVSAFRGGLNCAQAVFAAFAERGGYDAEAALGASAGFGGGMGRLQGTCGVVTGAYMVIGMHNSRLFRDNLELKETSYEMVRVFNSRFIEQHGSDQCDELIRCDLATPEGREQAKTENLHQTVCESCMLTSVRLLNEMLGY
jgi:C_GCAxxG_C_C family probable redox protein